MVGSLSRCYYSTDRDVWKIHSHCRRRENTVFIEFSSPSRRLWIRFVRTCVCVLWRKTLYMHFKWTGWKSFAFDKPLGKMALNFLFYCGSKFNIFYLSHLSRYIMGILYRPLFLCPAKYSLYRCHKYYRVNEEEKKKRKGKKSSY